MTHALREKLLDWLENGNEAQKAHARSRLEIARQADERTDPPLPPPPSPPPMPTFMQQAASATKAAAGFVASGFAKVSAEEQARRLEICHSCEMFVGGRCKLCGCYMSMKTWIANQHCPIKLW